MGIVFIVLLAEIVTVIGSANMIVNGAIDAFNEIGDKGLRIDKTKLGQDDKSSANEIINLNFSLKGMNKLAKLSLLIPGINLITAAVVRKKFKKGLEESEAFQKCLVPMTECEKIGYDSCNSKQEKMHFMLIIAQLEEGQELIACADGNAIVCDNNLTIINEEPLVQLAYTFDDVKRLNEATGYTYRIGKVNGTNTAIIGIHGDDYQIKKITFGDGNKYDFVPMSEEEAKNQKFIIYPSCKEDEEKTKPVITEILNDRKEADKKRRMSYINEFENEKSKQNAVEVTLHHPGGGVAKTLTYKPKK